MCVKRKEFTIWCQPYKSKHFLPTFAPPIGLVKIFQLGPIANLTTEIINYNGLGMVIIIKR